MAALFRQISSAIRRKEWDLRSPSEMLTGVAFA
jgi:hypothetical protein